MAGRLSELRIVDTVQTQLSWGFIPATWVGAVLFPIITVVQEAGKVPKFGTEAFRLYNTKRPPRGTRARIDFGISSIDYRCEERSLECPLDLREIEEAAAVFDARTAARETTQLAIFTDVEKEQAAQARLATNYATGNKITLSGTSQWSDFTTPSHPIAAVRVGKAAIRGKIGVNPNVFCMGEDVFVKLQDHPDIIARIQYSQKGIITPELLAEIFGIEKVVVGSAAYASEADVFTSIWGKDAMLAYVAPGKRTLGTPTFGSTFRKHGRPRVFTYGAPRENSEIVVVEDNLDTKVLSDVAGYLFTDAVA